MSRLPDVNEMYPQEEPVVWTRCANCGEDIYKGENMAETDGYDFCGKDCHWELSIKEGNIVERVAGDETLRIVR